MLPSQTIFTRLGLDQTRRIHTLYFSLRFARSLARLHATCFDPDVIDVAAARRDLVKEGFPLHDDHIPYLLESIGDHEQDIIETVLFAVANAR